MEEGESVLILVDELRSEDHNTKLHAINSLSEIAEAIGAEKSREELIPFLGEMLEDDSDEVLLALASKLGDLADAVGRDHISALLPLLLTLASNEEEVIRERAGNSLVRLAALMTAQQHSVDFLPLVKVLADADSYGARISACALFASACRPVAAECQDEMLKTFIELAHDDTPGVRRSAASSLCDLIAAIRPEAQAELFKLFEVFIVDEHDSVRQMACESAITMLPARPTFLGLIKNCASDRSWRVRYSVAISLERLCEVVTSVEELLPMMLSWLSDSETEVRSASAMKLPLIMLKLTPATVLTQIFPALEPLSRDSSPHVKIALIQTICQMPAALGVDNAVTKLLPLVGDLLRDEAYEVRLSFSEGLLEFCKGFSPDQLCSFVLPLCLTLMSDQQWHVRLKTVENLTQLVQLLGQERFKERLSEALVKWVEDPVFAVREAVLEAFGQLASTLGAAWINSLMLPFLRRLSVHAVFTKRMITLVALTKLHKVLYPQDLVEILGRLVGDPVPNIKFNAAKVIKLVGSLSSAALRQTHFIPLLQRLKRDPDFDVRYFATDALKTLANS